MAIPSESQRFAPSRTKRWVISLAAIGVLFHAGCGDDSPQPDADASGLDADDDISVTDTAGDPTSDPTSDTGLAPLAIPDGCNPLASEQNCLLPYPSDFFLDDDASTATGHRLAIPASALPMTDDGAPLDLLQFFESDGFSHAPVIEAVFPNGVQADDLVFYLDDVTQTLQPQSTTIILDALTGEPVLHFAELDMRRPDLVHRQALMIRPFQRLDNDRTYIVAVQGLSDADGVAIAAPEGFRRLRDQETSQDPVLAALAERYESSIFPALEGFGVERADLQLAWEFSTRSFEDAAGDLLAMRADAIQRWSATPPVVTITRVEEGDELPVGERAAFFRRVEGTIEVPLYLTSTLPRARIARDSDGVPTATQTTEVPFLAWIPHTAVDRAGSAQWIQYGHGFLGDRSEIAGGSVHRTIPAYASVFASVDTWGLSTDDRADIVTAIVDEPNEGLLFVDRVHQAIINHLALTYAATTTLLTEPAFRVDEQTIYDPEHTSYMGLSAGHIIGGTLVPLSPHFDRAVLNVGGGPLTLIMSRSVPFGPLIGFMSLNLPDPLDIQQFVTLSSTALDGIDPTTYAPLLTLDPLPDAPSDRRTFMSCGIGDTQVPNLSTHFLARSAGLSQLGPAPRPLPSFDVVQAPFQGSAFVEYDFGYDPLPDLYSVVPDPSAQTPVHDLMRTLPVFIEQASIFLETGELTNPCDGPCDGAETSGN